MHILETQLRKDCSESFIQTQKKLELQSATSFDYKYDNTVEFLICIDPNSQITLSRIWNSRTSERAIILQSYVLDALPKHSNLKANKRLSTFRECAVRCVTTPIPSIIRVYRFFLSGGGSKM